MIKSKCMQIKNLRELVSKSTIGLDHHTLSPDLASPNLPGKPVYEDKPPKIISRLKSSTKIGIQMPLKQGIVSAQRKDEILDAQIYEDQKLLFNTVKDGKGQQTTD